MASVLRKGPLLRGCEGRRDGWQRPPGANAEQWEAQAVQRSASPAEQAILAMAGRDDWFTAQDVRCKCGCSQAAAWKHATRLVAEGMLECRKIVPPGKRSVVCEYRVAA
jgi:hypothetical protein